MTVIEYITDTEQWDDMRAQAHVSHPSFDPEWEEMISTAFPYISFRHMTYRGMWGLRYALVGKRITTAPFSDGGDIFALGDEPLSLRELRRDISDISSSYRVQINEDLAPVSDGGEAPLVDYKVHLASPNELLGSFRSTLRHVLEHTTDLRFSRVSESDEIRAVYNIYLKTMQSVQNLALPFSIFEYLAESHDMYAAYTGNRIVSFATCMTSGKNAVYYLSGATKEGKEHDAPTHLLFYAMKEYHKKGLTNMYLGGTRKGSGLEIFKRGWRGDSVPVHVISSETTDMGRTSPLRNLWSLIPISLTPHISKVVGKYVL